MKKSFILLSAIFTLCFFAACGESGTSTNTVAAIDNSEITNDTPSATPILVEESIPTSPTVSDTIINSPSPEEPIYQGDTVFSSEPVPFVNSSSSIATSSATNASSYEGSSSSSTTTKPNTTGQYFLVSMTTESNGTKASETTYDYDFETFTVYKAKLSMTNYSGGVAYVQSNYDYEYNGDNVCYSGTQTVNGTTTKIARTCTSTTVNSGNTEGVVSYTKTGGPFDVSCFIFPGEYGYDSCERFEILKNSDGIFSYKAGYTVSTLKSDVTYTYKYFTL